MIAALMYHAVSPVDGRYRRLGLRTGLLHEQLSALVQAGYQLVGLTEALKLQAGGDAAVVALTFDDAYEDFLQIAVPVLADLGARATVYVPTAHVGGVAGWLRENDKLPRILSYDALAECLDSGCVEIGSHSHTHRALDIIPASELAHEVRGSREQLEDRLGVGISSFCYPHGYHSRGVRNCVAAAGYDNACEVGRRLREARHRLAISRLAIESNEGPECLLVQVSAGGPRLVPTIKRALQPSWRQVRRAGTLVGPQRRSQSPSSSAPT
jgi:peptidoglycan/xylan/chitin deacetylase (PgdA/CDA1 family)